MKTGASLVAVFGLYLAISAGSSLSQETYRYADNATHNSVAVDSNGNVYIADPGPNLVRKVSSEGLVTIFAGNGKEGFSGDGGPAVSARLSCFGGIAIDAEGNIFFSDTGSDPDFGKRVRKVTRAGTISTVAGNGQTGFSGDGGPATLAKLQAPRSLAIDSKGNLFVLDGQSRIRRVSTDGVISTIAGSGTPGFSGDGGLATLAQISVMGPGTGTALAVNSRGDLYIADNGNHRIRVVRDGVIFTVDPK